MTVVGEASLRIFPDVSGIGRRIASDVADAAGDIGKVGRVVGLGLIAGAAVGVGVGGLAVVGAMTAVAATAGAAFGALGIGVAIASQAPEVQAAGSSLMDSLKSTFTAAAEPLVAPLVGALGTLGGIVEPLGAAFGTVFQAVAPLIEPMAAALTELVINALPGFVTLVEAGVPVIQALIPLLPALGSGFTVVAGFVADVVGALPGLTFGFREADVTSGGLFGSMERVGMVARLVYDAVVLVAGALPGLWVGFREGDVTSAGLFGSLERVGMVARELFDGALTRGQGVLALLGATFTTTIIPAAIEAAATFAPLVEAIGGLLVAAVTTALPILGQLGSFVLGQVLPAILDLRQYLSDQLVPIFTTVVRIIADQVVPILGKLASFFVGTVLPAVMEIVRAVAENLRPVFEAIVGVIRQDVLPAVQQLLVKFDEYLPTIQRVISIVVGVTGEVLKFASTILGAVLPPVIRFAGPVLGGLIGVIGDVIGVVIQIILKLAEFARGVVVVATAIGEFGTRFARELLEINRTINDFVNGTIAKLGDVGAKFVSVGRDIIAGIVQGITREAGKIAGAARDAARAALDSAKDFLGINSPSTVARLEVGQPYSDGTALGIRDQIPDIRAAARAAASAAVQPVPARALSAVRPTGDGLGGISVHIDAREAALRHQGLRWARDVAHEVALAQGQRLRARAA